METAIRPAWEEEEEEEEEEEVERVRRLQLCTIHQQSSPFLVS